MKLFIIGLSGEQAPIYITDQMFIKKKTQKERNKERVVA
jgi:hypothetical protein